MKDLDELVERMTERAEALDEMAREPDHSAASRARLAGKAEGFRLALSFVYELRRSVS